MAVYSYSGVNEHGFKVKGVLESDCRASVVMQLSEQSITPLEISAIEGGRDVGQWIQEKFFEPKPSVDDMILIWRQLYSLTKAGIPILRALKTLQNTQRKPILEEAIKRVMSGLESGLSLSNAMGLSPKVFSPMMVSLVHVGENTGRLDKVFKQLTDYLELEKSTLRDLKQTMRYPIIVMVFITIAVLIVNYFVVPNFLSIFSRLGADLPMPTQILMASSHLFVNYWWALGVGGIVIYAGIWRYISTHEGRYIWDRYKLLLPGVGEILERVVLTRFARVFAMMLKEGVPILSALSIVSGAVGNAYINRVIQEMMMTISSGTAFTQAAIKSQLFTPIVIQMMAVGESSGDLDQLLDEVADYYESEVEYDLKRFSDWIEPVLVIILALMALVLALGVFLPLWDLGSIATRSH